ncbi:DUF1761 domain-containing protein [Tumebacillus lipolyticus]|uniref:DUF1761 domain-containing protein n=1 Tax=Tumebacillus lipolyticus TaxID=1280370 RepID=A0ABW4ZUV6_9BACL
MDFSELNWLAILVSGLCYYAIGGLWYSPLLFGNAWIRLRKINQWEMTGSMAPMIGAVFVNLGSAFILALLLQATGVQGIADGLQTAILAGITISLAIGLNHLFENAKFKLFLLTIGYHLLAYVAMGIILSAWT